MNVFPERDSLFTVNAPQTPNTPPVCERAKMDEIKIQMTEHVPQRRMLVSSESEEVTLLANLIVEMILRFQNFNCLI